MAVGDIYRKSAKRLATRFFLYSPSTARFLSRFGCCLMLSVRVKLRRKFRKSRPDSTTFDDAELFPPSLLPGAALSSNSPIH